MVIKLNRSHKQQLIKLKSKNEYSKRDLEIAKELLHQNDPPFNEEVQKVVEKITKILKEQNK